MFWILSVPLPEHAIRNSVTKLGLPKDGRARKTAVLCSHCRGEPIPSLGPGRFGSCDIIVGPHLPHT